MSNPFDSLINSKEFADEIFRKVTCYTKYADRIKNLLMHPNRELESRIKQELVLFITEYNNL